MSLTFDFMCAFGCGSLARYVASLSHGALSRGFRGPRSVSGFAHGVVVAGLGLPGCWGKEREGAIQGRKRDVYELSTSCGGLRWCAFAGSTSERAEILIPTHRRFQTVLLAPSPRRFHRVLRLPRRGRRGRRGLIVGDRVTVALGSVRVGLLGPKRPAALFPGPRLALEL